MAGRVAGFACALAAWIGGAALAAPAEVTCDQVVATPAPAVDARARGAAQRGLDFLAADTVRWQETNNCYGCHVQAVTLSALAVGASNQYTLDGNAVQEVIRGITTAPGGSRSEGGLRYAHGAYLSASKSLGGAAFARYDALAGPLLRDDLVQTADELLAMRDTSGSIRNDYTSPPVAIGPLQDTVLAMVTWKQAYEATAEPRYGSAVTTAEDWLETHTEGWSQTPPSQLQHLNYALLGFDTAGSGMTEPRVQALVREVTARQNDDGGWALAKGTASDAYATGQALYTLRSVGIADSDPAVSKGTGWLIDHQRKDGGWSSSGRQRAEAMWAVLGLVSVDVLSLAVEGVSDGDRVEGTVQVRAKAFDNQGGRVQHVQLLVDDVPVAKACGPELTFSWDTNAAEVGPHLVDVVAVNATGRKARRRLEVFTGPVYLTRLTSRWDDGGTVVTLRNTAPDRLKGRVRVRVQSGSETVYEDTRDALQGPMSFYWGGDLKGGGKAAGVRFEARVAWLDRAGKVVQEESLTFVHADPDAVQDQFASVAGKLSFGDGEDVANSVVELVDGSGAVLRSTRSTASGNYRFDSLDEGKYRVRLRKKGFEAKEAEVDAAPAAAQAAQADLIVE